MTVTLIAAVAHDGVIGTGTGMPWHLPQDLAHFKRTTMGHAVVMGRRTFETIGRVLPGRRTVVVTRDRSWHHPGVEVAHDLDAALRIAGSAEVFVAGGGEIYAMALPVADRLLITDVDQAVAGSVRFPSIDPATWVEAARTTTDGLTVVDYRRRRPTEA